MLIIVHLWIFRLYLIVHGFLYWYKLQYFIRFQIPTTGYFPSIRWSSQKPEDMHLKACRRRFSQREAHKPEAERCPLLEEDDAWSQKKHNFYVWPIIRHHIDINSPLPKYVV